MTYSSLSAYKQQILNDFNNRPNYENEFRRRTATRLVEWAKLQPGQQVLDVATGTGLSAIAAAQVVVLQVIFWELTLLRECCSKRERKLQL